MVLNKMRWSEFRDRFPVFVLAMSIIGLTGHLIDWLSDKRTIHLWLSLGFAVLGAVCILLTPNRLLLIVSGLFGVVIIGVLGAIVQKTLWGLPLILPCGVLAVVLLVWKGKTIR